MIIPLWCGIIYWEQIPNFWQPLAEGYRCKRKGFISLLYAISFFHFHKKSPHVQRFRYWQLGAGRRLELGGCSGSKKSIPLVGSTFSLYWIRVSWVRMLHWSLVMEAPDTVGGCSQQRYRIETRSWYKGGNNDLVALFSRYYLALVITQMRHFCLTY